MIIASKRLLAALSLVIACASIALAQMPRCAECGMMVDVESRFSSRIVQKDATLLFCDIGDLLTHLKRKALPAAGAQVKDHKTGEWIDAEKACYVQAVKSFKTPMGWGIAAFKETNEAAAFGRPLDYSGMMKAL